MIKFLFMALALVTTQAGAIDFSSSKGRDFSERKMTTSLNVGSTHDSGLRIEAFVKTTNSELGVVGLNLEAPIIKGDHLSIRMIGGVSTNAFNTEVATYRVGVEFEYRIMKNKSAFMMVTNKYDPVTNTLNARPSIMTGARFHF
jgi:hypothetical protein